MGRVVHSTSPSQGIKIESGMCNGDFQETWRFHPMTNVELVTLPGWVRGCGKCSSLHGIMQVDVVWFDIQAFGSLGALSALHFRGATWFVPTCVLTLRACMVVVLPFVATADC